MWNSMMLVLGGMTKELLEIERDIERDCYLPGFLVDGYPITSDPPFLAEHPSSDSVFLFQLARIV